MIPELVGCFERTVAFLQASVADLSDEDIVGRPTPAKRRLSVRADPSGPRA